MKTFVNIILYLWQLPQNLLGIILLLIYLPEKYIIFRTSMVWYSEKFPGGISLGKYIIVNEKYWEDNGDTELHEYGHSIQSMWLGPLYLFVIGIPSILWAAWWNESRGVSYYKFYTEVLADKLGGVER